MQASQVERDAALALLNKEIPTKAILHYDTTSRRCVDGEWPAILLSIILKMEVVQALLIALVLRQILFVSILTED